MKKALLPLIVGILVIAASCHKNDVTAPNQTNPPDTTSDQPTDQDTLVTLQHQWAFDSVALIDSLNEEDATADTTSLPFSDSNFDISEDGNAYPTVVFNGFNIPIDPIPYIINGENLFLYNPPSLFLDLLGIPENTEVLIAHIDKLTETSAVLSVEHQVEDEDGTHTKKLIIYLSRDND